MKEAATYANWLSVTGRRLKRAVQVATGENAGWFATQHFLAEAKRRLLHFSGAWKIQFTLSALV